MWSKACDQSFIILAFLWEKLSKTQFYKSLNRNMILLGVLLVQVQELRIDSKYGLKLYTSMGKWLKLKARKFLGGNFSVCRSCRGKAVRATVLFLHPE